MVLNLRKKLLSEVKIEYGYGRNTQEALDSLRINLPTMVMGVYKSYRTNWVKIEEGDCVIQMTYVL